MTPSTLDVRLSPEARTFLRAVRYAGGSLCIEDCRTEPRVRECVTAGVLAFAAFVGGPLGKTETGVALTGKGHAYLDRLLRAH
ncbi:MULTISPECIES: hypothetical protein [unclassified Ensifer]|uniref:hypothetical protein n=1 Tax=unclassified Ensifer TaxID=2633371 RepID=UPI0007101D0D|nr:MULTISPECIES: hypothetical protein [unclassified Ensifer]KQW62877.1 hypothetical protein ASD02_01790 [Ensifer sp. Root1252]KRC83698.1 hypothetical protein ASE32_01780 [Ensifer sp. Root231]KRD04051.1 hypothetical protein ASE47_00440 [Ensifer sp. Root258]